MNLKKRCHQEHQNMIYNYYYNKKQMLMMLNKPLIKYQVILKILINKRKFRIKNIS